MGLLGSSYEVEGSIPVNVFLFILILYKQLNILGLDQDSVRTGD